MDKYLRVGTVTRPHGTAGEVKVYPTTDDIDRFRDLETCYAARPGEEPVLLTIRSVKRVKNLAVLGFEEITDMNGAEALRGKDLLILRSQGVPLKDNENYIGDLIGMRVVTDDGQGLGELTEVMETAANAVFSVRDGEGREILIPSIHECILDVNLEENVMTVHLLPGLRELQG